MDIAGNQDFGRRPLCSFWDFFERKQDPTAMKETEALIDDESQDWLSDLIPGRKKNCSKAITTFL